jgi:hypothetical protein
VGNGFVAGELERAGEGFCGVDGFGFHWPPNFSMGSFGVRELCSRFRAVATGTQVIVLRKGRELKSGGRATALQSGLYSGTVFSGNSGGNSGER